MHETDLHLLFTRPLNAAGWRYFVTGSVAGMIYGEPRLTMDVDLVLVLPQSGITALVKAFEETQFYVPPTEVIMQEAARAQRGHFNLIHHDTGFKADVYLAGNDPLHAWAFTQRREVKMGEDSVWLAPPEYVIVRKLEFFREGSSEKHVRDIRAMLDHSADEIDQGVLAEKVRELGLQREWSLVSESRPS